jgi:hypothetical protein
MVGGITDTLSIFPAPERAVVPMPPDAPVKAKQPRGKQAQAIVHPGPMASKRWITELEVESIYGFPIRTLQNWRLHGDRPPYCKFKKSVLYQIAANRSVD